MVELQEKVFYDASGNPIQVLLPYDQFQSLVRMCGLDLDETEEQELQEALEDSKNKNTEAFVAASEV